VVRFAHIRKNCLGKKKITKRTLSLGSRGAERVFLLRAKGTQAGKDEKKGGGTNRRVTHGCVGDGGYGFFKRRGFPLQGRN